MAAPLPEAMSDHTAEIARETASDREWPRAEVPQHAWLRLDLTTCARARPGKMNGTLRLEQSYAKELSRLMQAKLKAALARAAEPELAAAFSRNGTDYGRNAVPFVSRSCSTAVANSRSDCR